MAETKTKKKKKITSAGPASSTTANIKEAAPVGNATGLRIGAVLFWIAALALEVVALFMLLGKIDLKFTQVLYQIIGALVLDLICVIVGSQFWKKANHIKPASEKNKLKFWLWNNMGLIVCAFAFIPFVILTLTNKDADKKTKTIATVVAIIACLIGGVASIDWNPVSQEQQQAAMNAISTNVYWSPFGRVYHTHTDCSSLNQTEELTEGNVEQAIAANRTRLCSFCARKDDIQGVVTDGKNVDDADVKDDDKNESESK